MKARQEKLLICNTATQETHELIKNNFHTIVANFQSNLIRNDKMAGREYTVVPMVMIVEGVLDGSNGPLYYPAEQLNRTPEIWNHKPIIVYHPSKNSGPVTACDPDILTNRQVGVIMNTKFVDGRLKAEAWIEKDRAKVVDERVAEAIENQQMMELSTGLFSDTLPEEGEWNGKAYTGIALNYRPDHLALLPDQKGACSIDDGAGFIRNSEKDDKEEKQYPIAFNQQSHDNIRNVLSGLIHSEFSESDVWIEDVYEGFFIYSMDGKLYARDYKELSPSGVELVGTSREVVRVTEYRTPNGDFVGNSENEGEEMDKKKLVAAIIKNTDLTQEDEQSLMAIDEKLLEKMAKAAVVENEDDKEEKKEEVAKPKEEEAAVETQTETTETTENAEVTVEQYVANAPAGIQDMLVSGLQAHQAEKVKYINVITSNELNTFSKEQLNTKPLGELKSLAALAAPVKNKDKKTEGVDFSGLGLDTVTENRTEVEPLVAPTMNFDE